MPNKNLLNLLISKIIGDKVTIKDMNTNQTIIKTDNAQFIKKILTIGTYLIMWYIGMPQNHNDVITLTCNIIENFMM